MITEFDLRKDDPEHNIQRVAFLTDNAAGEANLRFTDDESTVRTFANFSVLLYSFSTYLHLRNQGYRMKWGSSCCFEIVSKCLFQNLYAIGRLQTSSFGPPLKREIIALGHTMV